METILDHAREYWAVLNGPADGWGQHCHPRYGASHWMLGKMYGMYGEETFEAALRATRSESNDRAA